MKTLLKIVGGLAAAFVVLMLVVGGTMSPEKSRAYDAKSRVEDFCKKAMEDAAPGGEKRQTRAMCDQMLLQAEQQIRDAK